MTFKMVVFDWDGTLLDSTGIIAKGIRHACQVAGLEDPGQQVASYVIGMGLVQALHHAAPQATEQQLSVLIEAYKSFYLSQDQDLALFSGVIPLLKTLNKIGVICTVATGKSRPGLNRAMENTGTAQYFMGSRCADECHSKPHPQMILELIDEFCVSPEQVLMIGDTTHDLNMAHAAGVQALAVQSGAHSPDMLKTAPHLQAFLSINEAASWLIHTISGGADARSN
jgi:phosphoglycolate phosphatase